MPGMKEKHDATMIDAGDRHAILVIDIRIFDPNGHVAIGKIRCLERLHVTVIAPATSLSSSPVTRRLSWSSPECRWG
jgi:hypothetical protein